MKDDSVNPIIKDFIRTQTDIKIDRYSDKGGFGELYFGKRNILGDRVALKFYELDYKPDDHNEPQLLKEIEHENILPIIDAKVLDNDIAYYLTPEISGGDLQDIIDKYVLETETAINIIQGILKGLNELHKSPRNLVHRDIKSNNILIDKNTGKPFLADFGTVKRIPDDNYFVSASKFSFLYSPPEVFNLNEYYKRSDLYQVGILLYQALGGFFPINTPLMWLQKKDIDKFNSLSEIERQTFFRNQIMGQVNSGKIINIKSLPVFINRKLKSIIKKSTATDSEKRYKNCSEFLKDLFDYQKSSKNWWIENDIIFSFHLKKKTNYRIIKRKDEFVVEAQTKNGVWRKRKGTQNLKTAIAYIESL